MHELPINPDAQLDQLMGQLFQTLTEQLKLVDSPFPLLPLQPSAVALPPSIVPMQGMPQVITLDDSTLASLIDHTLLKANATRHDIETLCHEGKMLNVSTICINSCFVELAKQSLQGSAVKVCAVVGFPLGAMLTSVKVYETQEAVRLGAEEIDMVVHQGALRARDYAYVLNDIHQVVRAASPAKVKVILEMGSLSADEKAIGVVLCKLAGAHFVKTSTGFGNGGATVEDVMLMRRLVGTSMGVKASGGIRTREDAERMVRAGASRIGTSSTVSILGTGTSMLPPGGY